MAFNNISYDKAKKIIDDHYGAIIWANGKAYPESDVVCTISSQALLSQGAPVAWRQTVHVEENGIKSIKYLYNDEKIMVSDEPLFLAPPLTEPSQVEKTPIELLASNFTDYVMAKSQGEPVVWARKWFVDGIKPYKEPNKNGRVSWAKQTIF